MSDGTRQTRIEAPDEIPLVRIVREFDAPASAVFRAHTDPDLLVRWLGPADLQMQVPVWDCRDGGEYRYLHERDGQQHAFRGCFHRVLPDREIVQTWEYEPHPETASLERLTLTPLDGGRTRLEVTSVVESYEARDAMLASGMEHGVEEGYRSLDDLLAGGPGRATTLAGR